MKKIACYTGTLGSGGIESATVSQYINMDHDKVRFDFIVDENVPEYGYYISIIERNGGSVKFLSSGKQSIGVVTKLKALYAVLRNGSYDAFHVHVSYPSSLFYCAVGLIAGISNRLATSHAQGTANNSLRVKIIQSLCRFLFPLFCTKRIGVSNVAGKWMYGRYRFEVIPNAIDTSKFKYDSVNRHEIRKTLKINNETLIGHIGRFAPDKNHIMILRVFKDYLGLSRNAKLLLIGDGPLHTAIEEEVSRLQLDGDVLFIKQTKEVHRYMHAMDLLLMPSLREACSVVVMEAQAASLPVLASDTIPLENKISDIMYYQSLDKPLHEWSGQIQNIIDNKIDRSNVSLNGGDYPVDIKDLAKKIQSLY